jgi:5-methylcytosine-specific restriction endonuclease McrA
MTVSASTKWYRKNRDVHKQRMKKRQEALLQWLRVYRSTLKCQECGESDSRCLDFHHRDPAEKTVSIAQAIYRKGWGKDRLLKEIAKCDVLCSNCHRKKHISPLGENGVAPPL